MNGTSSSEVRNSNMGRSLVMAAILLSALAQAVADVPPPVPDRLSLHDGGDVATIQFGGRGGPVGIPSWKAVVRRDDAGNLSALYVPADSSKPLGARTGQWPLAVVASVNGAGVPGTMSGGRENYAQFSVESFSIGESSPERIVVMIGGPSKNRHYEHRRTYTFTPEGVKIEGVVRALIDLRNVGLWSNWDRTLLADTHIALVPVRTQGREGWVYMQSTGQDSAKPLPQLVWPLAATFPLEIQLKLRRETPTYLKLLLDRNFESAEERRLVHNDKDVALPQGGRRYGKIISMISGKVPEGTEQTYQVRYEFETRE
jgi:hypothetical protein